MRYVPCISPCVLQEVFYIFTTTRYNQANQLIEIGSLLVLLILEAEVDGLLELPKKEQISMLKRENLFVQSGKTGTSLQMCGCVKALGLYTAL